MKIEARGCTWNVRATKEGWIVVNAPPRARRMPPLTPREQEVLEMLVEGMTNPEIADALFLSAHTIDCHVRSLFRKLDVRTRTAAVVIALRLGLVDGLDAWWYDTP
jgi:DNA-binding NarL/FixJ family response regulator